MLKNYLCLFFFVPAFLSVSSAQEIVEVELLQSRSKSELLQLYGLFVQNGVDLYRVLYTTQDLEAQRDTASGLLVVPVSEEETMPMLVYQHGTVSAKDDVPSQLRGGYQLAELTGALGYISLAPDFLGLGTSRGFHPYVHAASEAWVAVDMLKAVKPYLHQLNARANEQLFITGYSQGGHAGMALHRELEQNYADEFPVTAAAHLSGPYSISGVMKDLFLGDAPYEYPSYLAFAILSYDAVYGLYDDLTEYFDPAFANLIKINLANSLSLENLNNLLKVGLRQRHDASIPKYILQDSLRQSILANPDHPLLLAMADNDVYKWAPRAPTRLFYCQADDQVPYANSLVAADTMKALGARDLEAIDVEPTADHGECVFPAVTAAMIFFAGVQNPTTATASVEPPNLKIFPNPARERLSVQGLKPGNTVELLNLQGRREGLWKVNGESLDIPLARDWRGMHFVRIVTKEGSWTRKVLIVR